MRKEEIAVFIDATEGMRNKSEEEDVERAYGSKSLEDVLAMQRGVLVWLGGILGKFSNN